MGLAVEAVLVLDPQQPADYPSRGKSPPPARGRSVFVCAILVIPQQGCTALDLELFSGCGARTRAWR